MTFLSTSSNFKQSEHSHSNIGIDSIGVFLPKNYLSLEELAKARKIDPDKYNYGILGKQIRIPEWGEDPIALGYKASLNCILQGDINPKEIDAVFLGTETPIYAVKSMATIYKDLLNIPNNCITQDISHACAAGTLAILNAYAMIESDLIKKALVIIVDISSYELESSGEPTQGAGAVALVLTRNPRIAVFNKHFGRVSGDITDFFRPTGSKNAQVFGHYSIESYLNLQLAAYDDFQQKQIKSTSSGDENLHLFSDYYLFHAPFAKLPLKFFRTLISKRMINEKVKLDNLLKLKPKRLSSMLYKRHFGPDITNDYLLGKEIQNYIQNLNCSKEDKQIYITWIAHEIRHSLLPMLEIPHMCGNLYSASIWMQLAYALENRLKANQTIYFGSYGSGATAISGMLKIKPNFKEALSKSLGVNYFLSDEYKNKISIKRYENQKMSNPLPKFTWVKITPYPNRWNFGINLNFCNKGCNLTSYPGLNYCPSGHEGSNAIFYPLIGTVKETQDFILNDYSPLQDGFALACGDLIKGSAVEFDLKQWKKEDAGVKGLLNWMPHYSNAENSPYLAYLLERASTKLPNTYENSIINA